MIKVKFTMKRRKKKNGVDSEALLNEAHRNLIAFKKTGLAGFRQKAVDRIRAAGVDIRKADEKNADWLLDMLENTQRVYGRKNPGVFKHTLRAGDRIILTGKAHADEGRTATVVGPYSIRKTSKGVVDLRSGTFVPVNWKREIPVKVSGGGIGAWPKAWVRPVSGNPRKRKRKNPTKRVSTKKVLAAWIRARSGRGSTNLSRAAMRRKSMKYLKKFSRTGRA